MWRCLISILAWPPHAIWTAILIDVLVPVKWKVIFELKIRSFDVTP